MIILVFSLKNQPRIIYTVAGNKKDIAGVQVIANNLAVTSLPWSLQETLSPNPLKQSSLYQHEMLQELSQKAWDYSSKLQEKPNLSASAEVSTILAKLNADIATNNQNRDDEKQPPLELWGAQFLDLKD